MFLAKVYVTLKPQVNDPQGLAILGGLHNMGYGSVAAVRAGKFLEIRIDEAEESVAKAKVAEMAQRLLANTVIEDFRIEIGPVLSGE